MLEGQVAYYLNAYLGDYLSGLDPQSLKISVLAGDVTLTNLTLKPEALNALKLPITVTAGLLGKLQLKVQWSQLGRVPVEISMERLYILARPRYEEDEVDGHELTPEEQAAKFEAMEKRVEQAMVEWVAQRKAKAAAAAAKPAGGDGYLKGFIDVIIGNLQLSVSDIHIRYEDDVSNPGHSFAAGLTLKRISANTVDEAGKATFVKHNPLELLRKGVSLEGLGVYFDAEQANLLGPANDWTTMQPSQWDALLSPSSRIAATKPAAFVLRPVDGRATYLRRGRNARKGDDDAIHEASVALDEVTLHVSKPQWADAQKLLEALSAHRTRAPFLCMRPSGRPTDKGSATAWWRYAVAAVRQQTSKTRMQWQHLYQVMVLRRKYVPEYERCVAAGNLAGDAVIRDLDKQLPEQTILLFRTLTYTKVEADRKQHAMAVTKSLDRFHGGEPAAASTDSTASPQRQQQQQQRTWWGWVTGASAAPATDASGAASDDGDGGSQLRADLTPEEVDQLMGLVKEQEESVEQDEDRPWSVRVRLSLDVAAAGVQLSDSSGAEVLRAGVRLAQSKVVLYPKTTVLDVAVNDCVLAGSGGFEMLKSGLPSAAPTPAAAPPGTSRQRTSAAAAAAAAGGSGASLTADQRPGLAALLSPLEDAPGGDNAAAAPVRQQQGQAMQLKVVLHPQNNAADAVVRVEVAPSYVTYDASRVAEVAAFFRSDQPMNLMALEAQAVARVDAARRAARDSLVTVLRKRQAYAFEMVLDAPKVALPVRSNDGSDADLTLVMDFGHFVLKSDPQTAVGLPDDEKALYECFSLQGSDLNAFLVDGPFSWASVWGAEAAAGGGAAAYLASFRRQRTFGASTVGGRSPRYLSASSSMDSDDLSAYSTSYTSMGGPPSASHLGLPDLPGGAAPPPPRAAPPTPRAPLVVIPLLDQCGADIGLQVARFASRRHAALRLTGAMPRFVFYFSPARLKRVMQVLDSALPAGSVQSEQPGSDKWMMDADHSGPVKVLAFRGIGHRQAVWEKRYAALYRGRMFVFPQQGSTDVEMSHQVWNNQRILRLSPECAGGKPNSIAILPEGGTPPSRLMADKATGGGLVFRVQDGESAAMWHQKLMQAQRVMSEMAGAGGGVGPDRYEPEGLSSSASDSDLEASSDASVSTPTTSARSAGASSGAAQHQQQRVPPPSVELKARLGELVIVVSGRAAPVWWPPEDASDEEGDGGQGGEQQQQQQGIDKGSKPLPSGGRRYAQRRREESATRAQAASFTEGPVDSSASSGSSGGGSGGSGGGVLGGMGVVGVGQDGVVNVDGERTLVALKTLEGTVALQVAPDRMSATVEVGNFEIEDMLVGGCHMQYRHLARSVGPSAGVQHTRDVVGQDVFYEPDELLTSTGGSCPPLPPPTTTPSRVTAGSSPGGSPATGHDARGPQQQLHQQAEGSSPPPAAARESVMAVVFERWAETSVLRDNVDCSVGIKISSLFFYCNRPTVAALMAIGTDLADAASVGRGPASSSAAVAASTAAASTEAPTSAAAAAADKAAAALTVAAPPECDWEESDDEGGAEELQASDAAKGGGGAGGGAGAGRVTFELTVEMQKLELELNYEEDTQQPSALALASVEHLFFDLQTYYQPATMRIKSKLGNARITDATLPPNSLYRNLVDLKKEEAGAQGGGAGGSLIELEFASHSEEESKHEGRVPCGAPYYTLEGHMSQLDIVFLYRFIQEFLSYLRVLLALQPASLAQRGAMAEATAPISTSSFGHGRPAASTAGGGPGTGSSGGDGASPAAGGGETGLQGDLTDGQASLSSVRNMSGLRSSLDKVRAAATAALAVKEMQQRAGVGGSGEEEPGGTGRRDGQQQQQQQKKAAPPFLLLMDLTMEAPLITMPRDSFCDDNMEVDLGSLSLSNSIALVQGGGPAGDPKDPSAVLQDSSTLHLGGLQCRVVKDKSRGHGLVQEYDAGTTVFFQRPLQDMVQALPAFQLLVRMASIKACVDEDEYRCITTFAAANVSEPPRLPRGARWLDRYLLPEAGDKGTAADGGTAGGGGDGGQDGGSPGSRPSARMRPIPEEERGAGPLKSGASVSAASSTTDLGSLSISGGAAAGAEDGGGGEGKGGIPPTVRVVVDIGRVQLELRSRSAATGAVEPLGQFTLANLWVMHTSFAPQGRMLVTLSLPTVEASDLRPGAAQQQRAVISSGEQGVSFLTLQYDSSSIKNKQSLRVRLQRPTLVAEMGFMLRVTQFFVPTVSLGGPKPVPYESYDISLQGGDVYSATEDVYLSPETRLLADSPGTSPVTIYDGAGHRLLLPPDSVAKEPLPLILVGAGKTLVLRNVRVVNAATLPLCVHLAQGAHLEMDPAEGCVVLDGSDPTLGDLLPRGGDQEEDGQQGQQQQAAAGQERGRDDGEEEEAGESGEEGGTAVGAAGGESFSGGSSFGGGSLTPPSSMGRSMTLQPSPSLRPSSFIKPMTPPCAPPPMPSPPPPPASLSIEFCALGMALQFLDLGRDSTLDDGGRGGGGSSNKLAAGTGDNVGGGAAASVPSTPVLAGSKSMASLAERRPSIASGLSTLSSDSAANRPEAVPPPTRILAVYTDVQARYEAEGGGESSRAEASLQGLRVETQVLAYKGGGGQQATERTQGVVLEPCRLLARLRQVGPRREVHAEVSEIVLRVSPDLADVAMAVQRALSPFMAPSPDQPLQRCSTFDRMWSSGSSLHGGGRSTSTSLTAPVSASVSGGDAGLTLWRPRAPPGYVSLGDVATAGDASPGFQVVAVAINSGLVAFPKGFTQVWSGPGIALWQPQAPPGYVALGQVASCSADQPPALDVVGCLHSKVCVASTTGPQLLAVPVSSNTPLAAAVVFEEGDSVEGLVLQCIDNSIATFFVLPAEEPSSGGSGNGGGERQGPPLQLAVLDIRSPLGVAPAALPAYLAAAQHGTQQRQGRHDGGSSKASGASRSSMLYNEFTKTRRSLMAGEKAVLPTAVNFTRLWWDKQRQPGRARARFGGGSAGPGVSLWRPVVPAGYCFLGDCLMHGYDPPVSTALLRDEVITSETIGLPLVKAPIRFTCVWRDGSPPSDPNRMSLWQMEPPSGYVALGCVVAVGTDTPDFQGVVCVRGDVVETDEAHGPVWTLEQQRQRAALVAWGGDPRLHVFTAVQPNRPQPPNVWRLKLLDHAQQQGGAQHGPQAASLSATFSNAATSVLLCDALRSPVLELDLSAITAALDSRASGVYGMGIGVALGVWSYNGAVRGWEPVVEPCNQIVKCEINSTSKVVEGVQPGMSLSIKSTSPCIHMDVTHAWVTACLRAYREWQDVRATGTAQMGVVGGRGSVMTIVDNRLGLAATLKMSFGSDIRTAELPAGQSVKVVQPLTPPPKRHSLGRGEGRGEGGDASRRGGGGVSGALHKLLLLVEVQGLEGAALGVKGAAAGQHVTAPGSWEEKVGGGKGDIDGPQLCVRLSVVTSEGAGDGAAAVPFPTASPFSSGLGDGQGNDWGVHTRAVMPSRGGAATWDERFLLRLPSCTPGPRGLVPLLRAELCDVSAVSRGGGDRPLASAETPLDVAALQQPGARPTDLRLELQLQGPLTMHEGDVKEQQQQRKSTLRVRTSLHPWQPVADGMEVRDSWARVAAASHVGARALALEGVRSPGGRSMWAPVPSLAASRSAAGAGPVRAVGGVHNTITGPCSSTLVPIPDLDCMLESSFQGGVKWEVLRSNGVVVNACSLPLQVCLLDDVSGTTESPPSEGPAQAAAAQAVASSGVSNKGRQSAVLLRDGSPPPHQAADLSLEQCFENERYIPLKSWRSKGGLLPTDPDKWSWGTNLRNSSDHMPSTQLPQGWEWDGPWRVVTNNVNVDDQGWWYGTTWSSLGSVPSVNNHKGSTTYVRRRKWVRPRRRTAASSSSLASALSGSSMQQKERGGGAPGGRPDSRDGRSSDSPPVGYSRQVLGVASPGDSFPLPYGWKAKGKQLQIRPVFGQDAAAHLHGWSVGGSGGWHSLHLDSSLQDGLTRLVTCPLLPQGDGGSAISSDLAVDEDGSVTALAASAVWVSLTVECERVPLPGGGGRSACDWRVVAGPPLQLNNQLPVPLRYSIWERGVQDIDGAATERQSGVIPSGCSCGVYAADPRQAVGLSAAPEGYQWDHRGGPLPLSLGFATDDRAASSATEPLPDRAKVRRNGGSTSLELHIDRDYLDMTAYLLRSKGQGATAAVAMGVPLSVSVFVPLWVVNASHLALTAVAALFSGTAGGTSSSSPPAALSAAASAGEVNAATAAGRQGGGLDITQARLITTRGSLAGSDAGDPPGAQFIAPGSVDMVNFPRIGISAGDALGCAAGAPDQQQRVSGSSGGGGQADAGERQKSYGLRLKVGSGGWTPVLPVDGTELSMRSMQQGGDASAEGAASMEDTSAPTIIRSIISDQQQMTEVVVRAEPAGGRFRHTQVLRVEPYLVVSNRTGLPLQLLQCRLRGENGAGGAEGLPPGSGSGGGGGGFRQRLSRLTDVPRDMGTSGAKSEKSMKETIKGGLSSRLSLGSKRRALMHRPTFGRTMAVSGDAASQVLAAASTAVEWQQITQMLPEMQNSIVRGSPGCGGADEDDMAEVEEVAVMDLPAGTSALPLDWSSLCDLHVLCVRSASPGKGSGCHQWSRHLEVGAAGGQVHLAVPVLRNSADGGGGGAEADEGATSGGADVVQGSASGSSGLGNRSSSDGHLISGALAGATSSGTQGHLVAHCGAVGLRLAEARRIAGSISPPGTSSEGEGADGSESLPSTASWELAILRATVRHRWVGALHIVLETLASDPPYLLENRTPNALQYRQKGYDSDPWSLLPPFSAIGYVWQHTPLPGEKRQQFEVEMRDASGQRLSRAFALDGSSGGGLGLGQVSGAGGDRAGGGSMSGAPGGLERLPIAGQHVHYALVEVLDVEHHVMLPSGLADLTGAGGMLGRGGVDRVLRMLPGTKQITELAPGLRRERSSPGGNLHLALALGAVEVSLVDYTPREVAALTMLGLGVDYSTGISPEGRFSNLRISLEHVQMDDMMYGTRCPVVLVPLSDDGGRIVRRRTSSTSSGSAAAAAAMRLITVTVVKQQRRTRRRLYYPCISARLHSSLQVAVSEALIWDLLSMYNRLGLVQQAQAAGNGGAGDIPGAAGNVHGAAAAQQARTQRLHAAKAVQLEPQQQPQQITASSDVPVSIRLLDIGDLSALVSFRSSPMSRPRWAGHMLSIGLNVANFTAAPVLVRGMEREDVSMLRSAFVSQVLNNIVSQLQGVALSLVRNFGLIGGMAKVLSVISSGLAGLASDEKFDQERAQVQRQRSIKGTQDGLKEAGQSIAKGVLRGFTGLVSAPIQGGRQGGLTGFVKGVGQGLVGGVAKPVSGFVDAVSVTMEGIDATTDKLMGGNRQGKLVTQRARLPRAIGGDRQLLPWLRGDNGEDARHEALGAALMALTLNNLRDCERLTPAQASEKYGDHYYEDHLLLPEGKVLVLSNRAIMLLRAPGFVRLEEAAMKGDPCWQDVGPAEDKVWMVLWSDVLCLELGYGQSGKPPATRLMVHRKGRPGQVEDEDLAHVARFASEGSGPQAEQARAISQRILDKYCGQLSGDGGARGGGAAAGGLDWLYANQVQSMPSEQLPEQMFCTEYELRWRAGRAYMPDEGAVAGPSSSSSSAPGSQQHWQRQRQQQGGSGPVISFWSPRPPSGNYRALGDVACMGINPPANPVPVYRNDSVLQELQRLRKDELPVFVPPTEYQLVWRSNGSSPVTVWAPRAPPGYRALGCVVSDKVEYPAPDAVVCVREDRVQRASLAQQPLWSYEPKLFLLESAIPSSDPETLRARKTWNDHNPDTWRCSMWPVDNPTHTFVAWRTLARPPPSMGLAVRHATGASNSGQQQQ